MEQLITPNPNVPCMPNYCVVYVQDAASAGADTSLPFVKLPTATIAYDASPIKHEDKNWPNLWIPVWFTVTTNPAGHVAWMAPDHSIWSSSSPTLHTPVHHASLADMERYWGNKLIYRGWTEDLETVTIIKESEMKPTNAQIDQWISLFYQEAYGGAPSDAVFADWRNVLNNNFVEGSLSIMQGTDTNAGALKNKPTPGFTPVTEQLYQKV